MVNSVSEKYTKDQLFDRACYRIAWNIRHMWEETGCSDTRLFLEPLIPEKFVVVGRSKKGADRKEHIVPRRVLCIESHKMFESGSTIEDVASFIKKHLKIVLISKDEQEHLDYKLKLKQTMPEDWLPEHENPFQRIDVANIDYEILA